MSENTLRSGKHEHHQKAEELPPVRIAVITISDSRTEETDTNGQYLKEQIKGSGFMLSAYHVIRDEPEEIEVLLEELVRSDAQIILTN